MKLHLGRGRKGRNGASIRSHKKKPYLEASWVPKEENRTVSMFWVSQECNQRGLCGQYLADFATLPSAVVKAARA